MEKEITRINEILELCKEELKREDKNIFATIDINDIKAISNLVTAYKKLEERLGEIDNKEVSDALHMLLHCALKDTEYETQKQQFEIVNAYIKKLEEKNTDIAERLYTERMANKVMSNNIIGYQEELENSIPKSKLKIILDKNCITFFEGDTDFPDDASRIIAKKYVKAEDLQELLKEE